LTIAENLGLILVNPNEYRTNSAIGSLFWQFFGDSMAYGNAFFKVEHKFKGEKRWMKELRAHDARRHGTMLGSIDLPLGVNALPSDAGFVLFLLYLSPQFDLKFVITVLLELCLYCMEFELFN